MALAPQDSVWPNRDRFVLLNGHASMLLWSVLHLTGTQAVNADYETVGKPSVSLEDIKHFRQLGSHAPGAGAADVRSNEVRECRQPRAGRVPTCGCPGGSAQVILIASGSEVSLAVEACEILLAVRVRARMISIPSRDIFEREPQTYRDRVLPPAVKARVAIEQASTFGWERCVGREGAVIGMETFGASAPLKAQQKQFGFEPDHVVEVAKRVMEEAL
jgi:transketolase